MHVLGCVRVSTEEQERSGLGVKAQIDKITEDCQRRGWSFEILMDLGCSGKHMNAELRRALELLRTGQADALVVAKMDRLARSTKHASDIMETASAQGWNLVLLDLAIDLSTPAGKAMANMLATFAQLERDMISTRTKEALAARARRGLPNGRKSAIPASIMRRIVLEHEDGRSFRAIASALTKDGILSPTGLAVWQESTVRRACNGASRDTGADGRAVVGYSNPGLALSERV